MAVNPIRSFLGARRSNGELFEYRYGRLATFNSERGRGLVHTPEYAAEMAELQARFDAEHGNPTVLAEPKL